MDRYDTYNALMHQHPCFDQPRKFKPPAQDYDENYYGRGDEYDSQLPDSYNKYYDRLIEEAKQRRIANNKRRISFSNPKDKKIHIGRGSQTVDKRKMRNELLKKIMKEKGMKLGEASRYIKENKLMEKAREEDTEEYMEGSGYDETNPIIQASKLQQEAIKIEKWELNSPTYSVRDTGIKNMKQLLKRVKEIENQNNNRLSTETNREMIIGLRKANMILGNLFQKYAYVVAPDLSGGRLYSLLNSDTRRKLYNSMTEEQKKRQPYINPSYKAPKLKSSNLTPEE